MRKQEEKHGYTGTRIYNIWRHMRNRCNNPNSSSYKHYGARGIKVCAAWNNSAKTFIEWALSHGYADNLTIDRIDVNGDYSPENCQWITLERQQQIHRNRLNEYTINGKTQCLAAWCREYKQSYGIVTHRLKQGMSIIEALTRKTKPVKYSITINGQTKSLKEWCAIYHISETGVRERIKNEGMTWEQAITIPSDRNRKRYRMITINGETKCLREWCTFYNRDPAAVLGNCKTRGISVEEELTHGKEIDRKNVHIIINGVDKTLTQWCEFYNCNKNSVKRKRHRLKMSWEDAVLTSINSNEHRYKRKNQKA